MSTLAVYIIRSLTFSLATTSKVETATNVLNELYKLKASKKAPFFAIRRAIKIQKDIVNNVKD